MNASAFDFHPLANIWPLMSDSELDALADDMERNGQQFPVLLYDGKILDGRNRALACARRGIEMQVEKAAATNDDEALTLVMSLNERRRHDVSAAARALAAARMANLRLGSNRYRRRVDGSKEPSTTRSAVEAAELMGVTTAAVKRAKSLLAHGDAETIKAVEEGRRVLTSTARAVTPRRIFRNERKAPAAMHGFKTVIPDDMTPEQFFRSILNLQRKGQAIADLAAVHSVPWRVLKYAHDLFHLADRDDLPPRDEKIVRKAVAILNNQRKLTDELTPVVHRVFGKDQQRNRRPGERVERFLHILTIIRQAADNSRYVDLPLLSIEQERDALTLLAKAKKQISDLEHKIREVRA